MKHDPQTEMSPQPTAPNASKKITVIILSVVVIAAIAVTVSQHFGGPLPTWDEIYEAAGFTEEPSSTHENDLAVHFVDVGQGDCIFVQTPTGESLLIDAGERGNEQTVVSYIEEYGDDTLEYVIATHPHSDHIGSLDDAIRAYAVQNVLMPRVTESNTPTSSAYKIFWRRSSSRRPRRLPPSPAIRFRLAREHVPCSGRSSSRTV